MEIVIGSVVVLHLLGMATIVGGWIAYRLGAARALVPLAWGARAQVLLGLILVGLVEMNQEELNYAKIGVKLVVSLAVVACAEIASVRAKRGEPTGTLINTAFALTLVNVLVAVLWTTAQA